MEFIQIVSVPSDGIPKSDSYCFAIKTDRTSFNYSDPIYTLRQHVNSNKNNGGWVVKNFNRTLFKLLFIY